ncbi:HAMP domain-containing protein [bacterium]|nr:HAMP domain-containing protein [bacterium]
MKIKLPHIIHSIWPDTIKAKIRFAMFGLIITVIIGLSSGGYYYLERLFLQESERKARAIIQMLAHSSVKAVIANDYLTVQELIDTMGGESDIWDAFIFRPDFSLLASHRNSHEQEKFASEILQANYDGTRGRIIYATLPDQHNDVMVATVPIMGPFPQGGRMIPLATAMAVFHLDAVKKNVDSARMAVYGLSFILLVMGWFFSRRLSNTITDSLGKLMTGVRRVSSGDLEHQIEIKPSTLTGTAGEIGELSLAFNRMAASLQKIIAEKIQQENLALLGEFASYVIHHLKSPLHGIRLAVENMQEELQEDSGHIQVAHLSRNNDQIIQAIMELEGFIRETLDIAKPIDIHSIRTDVNQLLRDVIKDFATFGVPIETHFSNKVIESRVDVTKFKMVFANLVINAFQAMERSENPLLRIETSNGSAVRVKFSDNGCGMPAETIEKIFNPFYTTKGSGNGLGLTFVKKIVEVHGGKLEVDSEIHVGTEFMITLPKADQQMLFQE